MIYRVSTWMRPVREDPQVLAIFCSGGRYTRYVDEFLEGCLRHEGADWLAVPGGPAVLAGRAVEEVDEAYAWREIEFLVEAHTVREMVLIFHEDCGHYRRHLGTAWTPELEKSLQAGDAAVAATRVSARFPGVQVLAYREFVDDPAVYFEPLAPGPEPSVATAHAPLPPQ